MSTDSAPLPFRPPMDETRYRELNLLLDRQIFDYTSSVKSFEVVDSHDTDAERRDRIALLTGYKACLQALKAAKARLQSNDYGYCQRCDGEISVTDLAALPHKRLCGACELTEHEEYSRRVAQAEGQRTTNQVLDRLPLWRQTHH